MNWYLFIGGALALIAFLIHAIVGGREFRILRPEPEKNNGKDIKIWIQGLSGWNWVGADLLLFGILMVVLAITNFIESEKTIGLVIGIYFLVQGAVWLGTVFLSRTEKSQIFALGQWILCFLLSALAFLSRG